MAHGYVKTKATYEGKAERQDWEEGDPLSSLELQFWMGGSSPDARSALTCCWGPLDVDVHSLELTTVSAGPAYDKPGYAALHFGGPEDQKPSAHVSVSFPNTLIQPLLECATELSRSHERRRAHAEAQPAARSDARAEDRQAAATASEPGSEGEAQRPAVKAPAEEEEYGAADRAYMASLGRLFPSLKEAAGVDPWDPEQLVAWLNFYPSSHAAQAGICQRV